MTYTRYSYHIAILHYYGPAAGMYPPAIIPVIKCSVEIKTKGTIFLFIVLLIVL